MINLRVYEDTYRDLRRKNQTKISFPQFMERMLDRNLKLRKQEFEERRIVLRKETWDKYFKPLCEN